MQATPKSVFELISEMGHEQLVLCHDEKTGLKAIISIHNTVLGPALGGTRMWQYASDADAITDALRLSEGMTYKAAISGLNLGGGKAVIIGNSRTDKSEAYFRRYGKFVQSLGGKYITAEDVGTSKQDMEYIAMETKHVSGLPEHLGGSGDPSPVTAYGVYMGIKASAKKVFGSDSLAARKVLVQGTGNVGNYLIDLLYKEGAIIQVADIFADQLDKVSKKHPNIEVVDPNTIYDREVDIYAPCALGATLNDHTIPMLKCAIVAGGANNQLADTQKHGAMLVERGIIYAPDFLINAGGLINVYSEIAGFSKETAMAKTETIYQRTLDIFETAEAENISTHNAAVKIAKKRISDISNIKTVL